jgi:flagellum-specific peptidoglycan hydrolase FlgJ
MEISLLRWLLIIILMTTNPILSLLYAPPFHITQEKQHEQIVLHEKELNEDSYEESLAQFVNTVAIKYKNSNNVRNFLNEENIDLIIKNCESYPSVVIAMAVLETGWGRHAIGNNYFGIKGKGHKRTTKEWDGVKYITISSSFQYYDSMSEGIEAHSNLLHGSRYNIGTAKTYKEATKLIKRGGYATDPKYEQKLNFIIEKYELYKLDNLKYQYLT